MIRAARTALEIYTLE